MLPTLFENPSKYPDLPTTGWKAYKAGCKGFKEVLLSHLKSEIFDRIQRRPFPKNPTVQQYLTAESKNNTPDRESHQRSVPKRKYVHSHMFNLNHKKRIRVHINIIGIEF